MLITLEGIDGGGKTTVAEALSEDLPADRTVFAAWQRQYSTDASAQVSATTQEALTVARSVGAEYAVIGSAVQLGGALRLVAEVRRASSGERLGQVEVQGSPDGITALANRLTRKVLGVLLGESEEQIPSVNLASITTSSLPALKAFLRGERHFRVGEYRSAIEDYEAAATADSTFALAYARLAISQGWVKPAGGVSALRQAYRLSEAAFAAPFEYVAMPLAIMWGVVVFGTFPDATAWIGIALIIGSGLYLLWRESVNDDTLAAKTTRYRR